MQLDVRPCPISPEVLNKCTRGVLQGRLGNAEPEALQAGDVFVILDGGRDRKHIFAKHLLGSKTGKDPARTVCNSFVMTSTEESWHRRRSHPLAGQG